MKPMDENAVLRFAVGELDAEEESDFLAHCEIAPDCWRDAVLAVSEHRRLVEALREACGAELGRPDATRSTKPPRARWHSAIVTATVGAAGLLLGIIATRALDFVSGREAPVAQNRRALGEPGSVAPPAVVPASIRVELPQTMPSLSTTQRAALEAAGFQVEEQPTVYIINADDGKRWAVPTRRTSLHYVKR
jgi:hypothetical protein